MTGVGDEPKCVPARSGCVPEGPDAPSPNPRAKSPANAGSHPASAEDRMLAHGAQPCGSPRCAGIAPTPYYGPEEGSPALGGASQKEWVVISTGSGMSARRSGSSTQRSRCITAFCTVASRTPPSPRDSSPPASSSVAWRATLLAATARGDVATALPPSAPASPVPPQPR